MGWRAVAYLLLKLPVALVGAYVVVTLWIYGFFNLTYPLWWELFGSTGPNHGRGPHATAPLTFGVFSVHTLAGSFVLSAIGVAASLISARPITPFTSALVVIVKAVQTAAR